MTVFQTWVTGISQAVPSVVHDAVPSVVRDAFNEAVFPPTPTASIVVVDLSKDGEAVVSFPTFIGWSFQVFNKNYVKPIIADAKKDLYETIQDIQDFLRVWFVLMVPLCFLVVTVFLVLRRRFLASRRRRREQQREARRRRREQQREELIRSTVVMLSEKLFMLSGIRPSDDRLQMWQERFELLRRLTSANLSSYVTSRLRFLSNVADVTTENRERLRGLIDEADNFFVGLFSTFGPQEMDGILERARNKVLCTISALELEIDPDGPITADLVKRKYHRLSLNYHPDHFESKNPGMTIKQATE